VSDDAATTPRSSWFGRMELIIVILLGVVSLGIAYTSFESSLYDGNTQSSYSKGNNNETEAESLYLEANQQYVQDSQTLATLAQLKIAADDGDATAAKQYEQLKFMDVSEDLDKAMTKSTRRRTRPTRRRCSATTPTRRTPGSRRSPPATRPTRTATG
jgi:Tfp pilus assembly protein PilE